MLSYLRRCIKLAYLIVLASTTRRRSDITATSAYIARKPSRPVPSRPVPSRPVPSRPTEHKADT